MSDTLDETMFGIHPAADLFPMLDDTEMHELQQSVILHGLREKIKILPDPAQKGKWLILDGRNRFAAMRAAGISEKDILQKHAEIIILDRTKSTPAEYVSMANLERRNLNRQQRKELAGKIAIMIQEEQKDKPREEQIDALSKAAKSAGVSRRTAATAAGEQKGRSSAGPGTKKVGVLPGVANAQLGKIAATLDRLGHNWSMTLLNETKANCETVLAKLNSLIEKKAAEDAKKDAEDAGDKTIPADAEDGQRK
jgi:hypothetical protein